MFLRILRGPLQEGPRSPKLTDVSSEMAIVDLKKAKIDRRLEENGHFGPHLAIMEVKKSVLCAIYGTFDHFRHAEAKNKAPAVAQIGRFRVIVVN